MGKGKEQDKNEEEERRRKSEQEEQHSNGRIQTPAKFGHITKGKQRTKQHLQVLEKGSTGLQEENREIQCTNGKEKDAFRQFHGYSCNIFEVLGPLLIFSQKLHYNQTLFSTTK